MSPDPDPIAYSAALSDFRRARSQAVMKEILARFTGEPIDLLSYDEVRRQLRAYGSFSKGLKEIPLDAIVGSVGRYTDFTRGFLPRHDAGQDRWARVKAAADSQVGLPPIEVYKIGEVYFVEDGNHRVSVARQLGATHISAYVTEIQTRVPVTPDMNLDDLIIKAEYVRFLEQTRLDKLRPDADLTVTAPGRYPDLLEHINVHRYYMGIQQGREIPFEEAVTDWFDNVYLPVIRVIREQGIMRYFPERTEADLYLWLSKHRGELEAAWGWEVRSDKAVLDFARQVASREKGVFSRLGELIIDAVAPETLLGGPPPGEWRRGKETLNQAETLFADILVPISGQPESWYGLDLALQIAERESGQVHGLHIANPAEGSAADSVAAVEAEFLQRCADRGMNGHFILGEGEVAGQILDRMRFTDLVVLNQNYPPGPGPLAKLASGLYDLLQRSPRPILLTPRTGSLLQRILLAYNGSPKADEALYLAAYFAARWRTPLVVMTVFDEGKKTPPETLMKAKIYLDDHEIEAEYVAEAGAPTETILETAEAQACDFILMGSYGLSPIRALYADSTVNQILRQTRVPVLLAR
jgi:nucleotide-binding universal stress UspA family protein